MFSHPLRNRVGRNIRRVPVQLREQLSGVRVRPSSKRIPRVRSTHAPQTPQPTVGFLTPEQGADRRLRFASTRGEFMPPRGPSTILVDRMLQRQVSEYLSPCSTGPKPGDAV